MSNRNRRRWARRHVALPGDHGSWIFLLSPLFIGLFAGGHWSTPCLYLIVAALAGFLMRQPLTVAVKAISGRRSREDLSAACLWSAVYAAVGALHLYGLVLRGFGYLLYLAIPGLLVFSWYLWLVRRREERGRIGLEMLATAVLALAAPAGYWVGVGRPEPTGWWLWLLAWAQSAASVVYVHLRIEQRTLASLPRLPRRLRDGTPALAFTAGNCAGVLLLGSIGIVPPWVFLAYLLQLGETVRGTLRPAMGLRPPAIGTRQLLVSSLFTLLFVLAWRP